MILRVTVFVFLFFNTCNAGEIDGKGVICKLYGDTVGFFFEAGRVFEYKIYGGNEKLEIIKKEIGKYQTNENNIFFGESKINRKTLKFQKYSSFRGQCKAYGSSELFKKGLNIENLTKDNKI